MNHSDETHEDRRFFKTAPKAKNTHSPQDAASPHKIPGVGFTTVAIICAALGLLGIFAGFAGGPQGFFMAFGFLVLTGLFAVAAFLQRSAFELALMRRMMEADRGRLAPKIEGHVR